MSRGIAGQRQILIRLGPTNQVDGSKNTAESGVWRIRVKATPGEPAGPLNVYAAWGGGNDGLPQRQWPSKFILDGQFKDIVWLHGAGTILGSACSDKKHAIGSILVAGGYDDWSTLRRAKYSSAGPARNGRMNDWLAPTEESATLPGLLCIGTRSASLVRAQGTSFAAPQVARKIALGSPRVPRPKVSAIGTSGKPREEYGEGRL